MSFAQVRGRRCSSLVSDLHFVHRAPAPRRQQGTSDSISSSISGGGGSNSSSSKTCRNCGMSFTQLTNMYRHRKKCEGRFRLGCPLCGKGFSRRDSYNVHVAKHRALDSHEQYEVRL